MNRRALPLVVSSFLVLTSCGGDGTGPPPPAERVVTSIVLNPSSLTLDDGASATIAAIVKDQDGHAMSGQTPTWASSDTMIATVSGGSVTAVRPGSADVTAAIGTVQATVPVTVLQKAVALQYVSGTGQSATIASQLRDSLVVQVLDRHGDGVAGQAVEFAVTSGGGSATPGTATTDADGHAKAAWMLGSTAGTQKVEARAAGLSGSPVVFQATGQADTQSAVLSKSGGDGQSGPQGLTLANPLVVHLTDSYGNDIAGENIVWTVLTGGGSVAPTASTTRFDGTATTQWTLGEQTGTQTVRASYGSSTVEFSATAQVREVASVVIQPDSVRLPAAGDTAHLVAKAYDSGDVEITGTSFTWASDDTGVATVDADGVVTGVAAGSAHVTATAGTVSGSAVVTVAPPEARAFALGDTVSAEINPSADADTLKFAGTAGQEVIVFFQSLGTVGATLQLAVYDHIGEAGEVQLAGVTSDGSEPDLTSTHTGVFSLPRTDSFAVVVRAANPATDHGPYRFQVFPIDPAPEQVSASMVLGDTVSGETVSPIGDKDVFTFDAAAGQEINVFFQALGGASKALYLKVFRDYGTGSEQAVSNGIRSLGDQADLYDVSTGVFTIPATGTYSAVVYGQFRDSTSADNDGPYRFLAYPIDPAPEQIGAAIAVGDTISGESVSPVGDKDVFTFNGTAGTQLAVQFQAQSGSADDVLYLQVFQDYGTGSQLALSDSVASAGDQASLGAKSTAAFTLPSDGTYTVVVWGAYRSDAYRRNDGPYRFRVATQ